MWSMEEDAGPDEMGSSSETPYLRRPRAVAVRRSRFPQGFRRAVWWAGIIILVFLPLGFGGYRLGAYLLNSPRFQVVSPGDVVVEGTHYVSKEAILNALGVIGSNSQRSHDIFSISLKKEAKRIDSIPWVLSTKIVRSYPHDLTVYITERRPVAFVDVGGEIKMVDRYGVLLDPPEKTRFDFPIIKGLDFEESLASREDRIELYMRFMQQTSDKMSSSGWMVSEVDLANASNLKALLVQGGQTLLVYFGHEHFLTRYENLLAVLPKLRKTNVRIDSVDLRYRNQVVVNPVGKNSGTTRSAISSATRKAKGI